ncbi:WD repeat protein [Rasamsonia emersonii CBS 393.64]|uniref:WD repeat protein n=1 Tax=Rasamsonia emersonii (strain ATCC 16479 / CBS 393.64 / IMI 116815) TaxID=1408163 RepID=A0A0F4YFA2_RASE3|nr:WD repeat protein [Rasamsonia emersonii CBS 393.64]KKA16819.1 WD repeat protein [Rasamsonia emersonii CBS 393.64]
MANNSWSAKTKLAAGPGASLKITPSNSPVLRPGTRSPRTSPHQATLSLQTVIGTTTATPNGFSSHEPTRSFALCVGSAAILAEIDADSTVSQRFFRARPTATPVNPVTSFYNQQPAPTTPDNRNRSTPGRLGASASCYGSSPSGDWADSTGSRTWTSRERIKAVTSVAISPNGRFLAVGETGYNPRVLIFSTAKDAPRDVPLTILTEHSFGVRGLAFSSNSQYLATLGDINDAFLFVWAINLRTGAAKLHSTNKCTSFVRDMCWMGQTLITVGIRHVKVWRLADAASGSPTKPRPNGDAFLNSPGAAPKALSGRNCLLGPLGDHTFTCVSSISDYEAIICSESGAVCFLDDTEGAQKLTCVKRLEFGVYSIAVDSETGTVWLGGRGRKTLKLQIEELRAMLTSVSPSLNGSNDTGSPKGRLPAIISMGFLSTHMVTVDSTRAIHVSPIDALGSDDDQSFMEALMPAHRDPVLGVGPLKMPNAHDADFFTWSCEGTVNFWNLQGKCQATRKIELEQLGTSDDEVSNELKVLRAIEEMDSFVSGDRYGVLKVLSANPWKCVNEVRAHGGEVTDIAVLSCPGHCLVVSCGRDRMVQLFKKTEEAFELIQTMDDHVGAVGRVLFMNDGERLLSCSADRTVIIRDRATREADGSIITAFILSKVITLKVSPVSMTLARDDPDTLIVSTIDRQIQRFDVSSGRHIHSFRASDPETNDAVVMSSLIVSSEIPGHSPRLLVGVSTTDKSIRVYDFDRDTLLTREFGHSEGVSDVMLLESRPSDSAAGTKRTLISTGLDGVVMIWDLSVQQQQVQELSQANIREEDETPAKELTAAKPPLRRILSRSELAGFQRQDNPAATPTPVRDQSPPRIRRKGSRFSLAPPTNKNGNTTGGDTPSPLPASRRSPASVISDGRGRSPSPPSPKAKVNGLSRTSSISNLHRPSLDFRSRTKNTSEFGSLNMSTEQVCRTLRAYRKKLNGSTEYPRCAKELQRELDLTIHALGERAKRHQANADTENDSSGKENEKKPEPTPSKPPRIARRVPSTPVLGQKGSRRISRSRSLDADGEG